MTCELCRTGRMWTSNKQIMFVLRSDGVLTVYDKDKGKMAFTRFWISHCPFCGRKVNDGE